MHMHPSTHSCLASALAPLSLLNYVQPPGAVAALRRAASPVRRLPPASCFPAVPVPAMPRRVELVWVSFRPDRQYRAYDRFGPWFALRSRLASRGLSAAQSKQSNLLTLVTLTHFSHFSHFSHNFDSP
jgi:hypothetical protein